MPMKLVFKFYILLIQGIYIRKNGSIDEQCIIGQHVLIQTRNKTVIPGVIGKKPIHLTSKDECHSLKMHQVWKFM